MSTASMNCDVHCPHCGLTLSLSQDGAGQPRLHYDREEWIGRCRYPQLKSAAQCFASPDPGDILAATGNAGPIRKGALDPCFEQMLAQRIANPEPDALGRGAAGEPGMVAQTALSGGLARRLESVRGPGDALVADTVESMEITRGSASAMECLRLGLSVGDAVYRIKRVRVSDGRAFMIEEASMPAALFPDLETRSGSAQSIVKLAGSYGIALDMAEERINVAKVALGITETLGLSVGSSVAVLDRIVRASDGRPVEWRVAWCDLVKYSCLAETD